MSTPPVDVAFTVSKGGVTSDPTTKSVSIVPADNFVSLGECGGSLFFRNRSSTFEQDGSVIFDIVEDDKIYGNGWCTSDMTASGTITGGTCTADALQTLTCNPNAGTRFPSGQPITVSFFLAQGGDMVGIASTGPTFVWTAEVSQAQQDCANSVQYTGMTSYLDDPNIFDITLQYNSAVCSGYSVQLVQAGSSELQCDEFVLAGGGSTVLPTCHNVGPAAGECGLCAGGRCKD